MTRSTNATGILEALRLYVAAAAAGEVDPSTGPFSYGAARPALQVR